MKNNVFLLLTVAAVCLATAACGGKKKSDDIIAERVVRVKPAAPISMQPFNEEKSVRWVGGNSYRVLINRAAADSLPMVKDETGQKFVDNTVRLQVVRADGSVFFTRTFKKKDFEAQLDDDYMKTGILEGFVFDKVDGDYLVFAASVAHPQTDEYIPLVVRLSRMGNVSTQRDTSLDTGSTSTVGDDDDMED